MGVSRYKIIYGKWRSCAKERRNISFMIVGVEFDIEAYKLLN